MVSVVIGEDNVGKEPKAFDREVMSTVHVDVMASTVVDNEPGALRVVVRKSRDSLVYARFSMAMCRGACIGRPMRAEAVGELHMEITRATKSHGSDSMVIEG